MSDSGAGAHSLFRSEDMKFVQLTMSEATAHATLSAIGQLGCLHLNDLSGHEKGGGEGGQSEAYLHYKKRVAACFHWEKRLQALRQAMADNGVEAPPLDYPECERAVPVPDVVGACAAYVESVEEPLMQNLLFKKQQSQRIHEHIERQHVLEKVRATQLFRRRQDADPNAPAAAAAAASDRDIEFGATGAAAADADRQRLLGAAGAAGVHPGVAMDAKALEASQAGALGAGGSGGAAFSTLSGVIAVERQPFFERMLFRVSRGNAMAKFVPIEARLVDPATGEEAHKSVFTVLFVGRALGARIAKICQYVGATTVQIPADELSYSLELQDIQRRIDDFTGVLERTKHDIVKLLQAVAFDEHESFPLAGAAAGAGGGGSGGAAGGGGGRMGKSYNTFGNEMLRVSPLVNWECAIAREKAICDALRKCVLPQPGSAAAVVYAEGFVPAADAPRLAEVMRAIHDKYAQSVCDINALERYHNPPTYFRVNKFTETFQSIVNTYGWPRYKEANPGLFTIFTFPFLFGVMYGDIGHGTLLTLFALYLIWREDEYLRQQARRELGEIFGMAFGGRYLLVAMGACAVYCGIMYNDCFSIPWNVYGSTWHYDAFAPGADSREAKRVGSVYPVGIDPTWYGAKNELTFFNSLKMKLAVTIGVIQMSFGLVLQLTNHIHNGDLLGVFFEFVPQFLFLFCTFGYMIILIAIKLTTNWNEAPIAPPNLIQTMIGMFLSPGAVPKDKLMYESQATVQLAFLLIAFLSVPVMLFVRPCWEHFGASKKHGSGHGHEADAHGGGDDDDANGFGGDEKHLLHDSKAKDKEKERDRRKGSGAAAAAAAGGGGGGSGGGAEEAHGFGDLFIHQTIHTIEFVLGTVSNTASYLRLWALSLAHAELSTVFWEKMIMQYGVLMGSPVTVVIGFAVWATATFAVLMGMDVLECFLHALRLHWVEFQNKFFHADGYAFQPFDFKKPADAAA